ncbi:MAG: hypothetical protein IT471_07980 [Pseudomonadales bacterium]|nr:hypothetical protein [Pseudomonadales bacterium]MCC6530188.1 hypothetical protein [Pseudomonadales bacterium]MCP5332389.1 hypothetical protein [Pseudomonadales bacterium]
MPNSDSKPAGPPRLAPEIDEIATYQQRRQSGRPRDKEGQPPPGKSRGLLLVWLVLIALTAAIAGGGFLTVQYLTALQHDIKSLREADLNNIAALTALQARLGIAGKGTGGTGDLSSRIEQLDAEVRKLIERQKQRDQDLSTQSRQSIDTVQNQMGDLSSRMSKGLTDIDGVNRRIGEQAQRQEAIERQTASLAEQLRSIEAGVKRQDELIARQLTNRLRTVEEQLVTVQQADPGLLNAIERRLRENEAAVAAFDQQRMQLNRSMQELQINMRQLQQMQMNRPGG